MIVGLLHERVPRRHAAGLIILKQVPRRDDAGFTDHFRQLHDALAKVAQLFDGRMGNDGVEAAK